MKFKILKYKFNSVGQNYINLYIKFVKEMNRRPK